MGFRGSRSKPSIRENSLKSSCDIESALPLLLRAKARERAAAVHGSSTGEMRRDGKLDCSLVHCDPSHCTRPRCIELQSHVKTMLAFGNARRLARRRYSSAIERCSTEKYISYTAAHMCKHTRPMRSPRLQGPTQNENILVQ